jgi:predicted TIM-barrel fold metal-dependent hydrolase
VWAYEGALLVGRGDEVRPGSWDIDDRVADMDLDGVYAQVCFPSDVFGFSGRVFSLSKDPELGLASMKAYNDWHLNELAARHPGRIIPTQCVWYADPAVGAAQIRANAELGFRAATLPDLPHYLGLPRIGDPYWFPILDALEETGTVVCLHIGAAGWVLDSVLNPRPGYEGRDFGTAALFPASSMVTAVEWTFSGVPVRFPRLKIALSEGGIGWVPMAVDRLNYVLARPGSALRRQWRGDESPAELLLSRFWFCMVDNPSNLSAIDLIGSDHIMVETDYPHSDSTWPDTQELLARRFLDLPGEDALNMTYRTAEKLFGHAVPQHWLDTTQVHG